MTDSLVRSMATLLDFICFKNFSRVSSARARLSAVFSEALITASELDSILLAVSESWLIFVTAALDVSAAFLMLTCNSLVYSAALATEWFILSPRSRSLLTMLTNDRIRLPSSSLDEVSRFMAVKSHPAIRSASISSLLTVSVIRFEIYMIKIIKAMVRTAPPPRICPLATASCLLVSTMEKPTRNPPQWRPLT
ncbi:MAG: hypothetical protein BWY65_01731 [Firmicutes bacterium ADurb.Bin373]|nr:MAG: hypothetical protein BWY65_01731 [Firmicutes bacterium ADurb.Bin373]